MAQGKLAPEFRWDESKWSRAGIPTLRIHFPSLRSHDVAHLEVSKFVDDLYDRNNEDTCIFTGNFEFESDVDVALTGCPGSSRMEVAPLRVQASEHAFHMYLVFQIQFYSRRSNDSMFLAEHGKTTVLKSAFADSQNHDKVLRIMDEKRNTPVPSTDRQASAMT